MIQKCQCLKISDGLKCQSDALEGVNYCRMHEIHFNKNNISSIEAWNKYALKIRSERGNPKPKTKAKKSGPKKSGSKKSGNKWIRESTTSTRNGNVIHQTWANGKLHSYSKNIPSDEEIDKRRGEIIQQFHKFGKLVERRVVPLNNRY